MGTIKDRSGRDLVDTEEIKKRWKEHTDCTKKILMTPYNHNDVVSHSEPVILECEVRASHPGL